MRLVTLAVLGGLTAGCATTTATTAYWDTAYWDRRGATLAQLASESETCYQEAVAGAYPSALPASEPAAGNRLLARSTPPPALWKRSPRQAGFERYDEQLRYERCMRERGWTASARLRSTACSSGRARCLWAASATRRGAGVRCGLALAA